MAPPTQCSGCRQRTAGAGWASGARGYALGSSHVGRVTTALIALGGALFGVAVTFVGQRRADRNEQQRQAHETRELVNALAIDVFRAFLAASKAVERLAERREWQERLTDGEIQVATNEMWLRLQEVEVFCAPVISKPASAFVNALMHVVWNKIESVETYLVPTRDGLFATAGPVFQESADSPDKRTVRPLQGPRRPSTP